MEREDQNASLRSPLIQISGQEDGVKIDNDIELEQYKRKVVVVVGRRDIFEEAKKQLWLAGPLVSVGLLNFCIQIISVMFVGHLGELALSGASMATSFTSITGISVLVSCCDLPFYFYLHIPKHPFNIYIGFLGLCWWLWKLEKIQWLGFL